VYFRFVFKGESTSMGVGLSISAAGISDCSGRESVIIGAESEVAGGDGVDEGKESSWTATPSGSGGDVGSWTAESNDSVTALTTVLSMALASSCAGSKGG
jgi:hypothetical protein